MAYTTFVKYKVESKEQLDAAKKYDYHSSLLPEQTLTDIMEIEEDELTIIFDRLTCEDFEKFIPEFSLYLAKTVPEDNFSSKEAYCYYSVSYSEIRYEVTYLDKHLTVKVIHEGDGWDEYYGTVDEMEGIAVLPPYNYIDSFDEFVSKISEEYESCNITDHITDETEFIVTNQDPDDYSDDITEAIENGATIVNEEEFLSGFELWKYTVNGRPWDIVIDKIVNE